MSATVAIPAASSDAELPVLPIAGFRDVYHVSNVDKALQGLPTSANEALRSLYEKDAQARRAALYRKALRNAGHG